MSDALFTILFRVIPSAMVGALLCCLVIRYINWYMRKLSGSEGGSSEISKYLNAVEEREWETNHGGTMGFPSMSRGNENLRIEPRGECMQVVRRRDQEVIACFEVEDAEIAEHVFGLMARQLEKVAESKVSAPEPAEGGAQEVLMHFRDGRRQLFLLRSRGLIKVADVRSGKLQGAAVVSTEVEGRELLAALSCKNAAQLEKHRQNMKKMHAEPLLAGLEHAGASGLTAQSVDSYADDIEFDQDFEQRFS